MKVKRLTHRLIRMPAIHMANAALLAVLLVGVPAVTGVSLGTLRVSSNAWLERLVLAGLGLGVLANGLLVWGSGFRKERGVCMGWMGLHLTILGVALMAHFGWIEFGWLKDWLKRLAS